MGSQRLVPIGEELAAHAPSGSRAICQKSFGGVRWLASSIAVGSAVSCSLMLVIRWSGGWQHMAFLPMSESLVVLVTCLVNPSTTVRHVASSFLELVLSGLVEMVDG